jgi:hypothetical protein
LSLDTHVNRSDLHEVGSSVRPLGSLAENKGFAPDAIKLMVMKLTSDSIDTIIEPSRISDLTLSVEGKATIARRLIAHDITGCRNDVPSREA